MEDNKINVFVGMAGGFGPLAQVIPILENLDKKKFNIICNAAQSSRTVLESLGYYYIEIPNLDLPKSLVSNGQTWWDLDHYWGRFGYLDYQYVKQLIELRLEVIESLNPAIVISQFNPPTSIVSKILNIPHVSITQSCLHPSGKRVSWWKKPNEDYFRTSITVNKVLADYGLDPIDKMEDLHRGNLSIIPSFPEFDPITNDDVIYTGPMIWESANNYKGLPFNYIKTERPLIYAYTGRMHDSAGASGFSILSNIVEAFKDSDFDVIIATGEGQLPENFTSPSSNIIVTDWVPSSRIMEDCCLTIHHGGHGSCMLPLIKGIPSIVIPTTSEREYNARQLRGLGTGVFILPNEVTAPMLFHTANKLMSNKKIQNSSKQWSTKLKEKSYCGMDKVINGIEELIKS